MLKKVRLAEVALVVQWQQRAVARRIWRVVTEKRRSKSNTSETMTTNCGEIKAIKGETRIIDTESCKKPRKLRGR